jgi:hypothetical protein
VVHSGVEGADEPDVLYLNNGQGHFTAAAGLEANDGRGCGVHFADFDTDGRLDLLLTNGWGTPPLARGSHRLFRNTAPEAHWLEIRLVGQQSNVPGLGAWVEVEAGGGRQIRYNSGGSLYSQSLLPLHFGLGTAPRARLTVRWPSGLVEALEVAADQRLRLVEGESAPIQRKRNQD